MKIILPCSMPWGQYRGIEAEIIDIAPHITCATFAVHRPVNLPGKKSQFLVSNIETGTEVCRSNTKKSAIALAHKKLSEKSNFDLDVAMRRMDRLQRKRGYFYVGEAHTTSCSN
jgi:hypothetical protein